MEREKKYIINNKDWDKARMQYPHLSGVPNSQMHGHMLNLAQEFTRITSLNLSGKVYGESEVLVNLAKAAMSIYVDKSPRSILDSVIGIIWSPPPHIKHNFLYTERHTVEVEFIRRN